MVEKMDFMHRMITNIVLREEVQEIVILLCGNGKVECMEGQYCVKKAWEVEYTLGNKTQGNRWVCVECADIPRDTPLILKQGAIKLEKVEFGQAVIDPNLIEY